MTIANDADAALLAAIDYGQPVTLTGFQAHLIREALLASDRAHAAAMDSKLRSIREPARAARQKVLHAWATLGDAKNGDAK